MDSATPSTQSADPGGTGLRQIKLKVELGGGLETLFGNSTTMMMELSEPFDIRHLISVLATRVNPPTSLSLFCSPGPEWDIKPGILPLVNDEDWELLEPSGMEAVLKDGDNVLFISTLHGG
ncbi:uncharacterized protein MELLADRAFT_71254 [Melampsora larici-populina 98AG31]|uniref:Ubiquitin-related modifier 1 n=1 Tax=Melampsora larici-populina (strain 98AG31 / pathotype 3-4-7) TaxID=747676 RepID=F4RE34_MELLP|nr:uncharacterized protein MELLADRAFT_71254 [Melampsora larici-populina 98AG31]EGG09345.1 hypothetical protein MELLADRAFT_71254 [Melampsora larici-populina 98AG31]